jgi:hypothetical protein
MWSVKPGVRECEGVECRSWCLMGWMRRKDAGRVVDGLESVLYPKIAINESYPD